MTKNFFEDLDIKIPNPVSFQTKSIMAMQFRKIVINEDICDTLSLEFVYFISKLRDVDEKIGTKEPIEICVNSNGGTVTDCFLIVDTIEQLKSDGYEVITTNMGKAYSAAMPIALCGSTRKSYSRARYMWHDVSSGMFGKAQDMRETIEDIEFQRDVYYDIIKKYSAITDDDLRIWQEKKIDKYFNAQQMMELKGVDVIL